MAVPIRLAVATFTWDIDWDGRAASSAMLMDPSPCFFVIDGSRHPRMPASRCSDCRFCSLLATSNCYGADCTGPLAGVEMPRGDPARSTFPGTARALAWRLYRPVPDPLL